MKVKTPWIVGLVQIASVLFVLIGCLMVFIYTPFYSQWMLKALNQFVSFEINEVAARSQKQASLTEQESPEPGSEQWIARQAYLKLMDDAIQRRKYAQDLTVLQLRYQVLQKNIEKQLLEEQQQDVKEQIVVPMVVSQAASEVVPNNPSEKLKELLDLDSTKNKALMQQYLEFLREYPIEQTQASSEVEASALEIEPIVDDKNKAAVVDDAYAIVVLGGGLTLAENGKDIVVNSYTRLRLEKTLELKKQYDLPIVLSGVEAPYMQRWLAEHNIDAKLLENRSMNTCENSRFSALLLQKKGGAPKVMLVTDRYHMPRTRRLFALNGIATIPVEAPMPTETTAWQPSEQNYHHSRRANYEMLATLRDIWFGASDCREVP